jgi:hypothetical protein
MLRRVLCRTACSFFALLLVRKSGAQSKAKNRAYFLVRKLGIDFASLVV